MVRVLVYGSRTWTDRDAVKRVLSDVVARHGRGNVVVVHGGARGADLIGEGVARELGLRVEAHPADWSRGRGAGMERNREMLRSGLDEAYGFRSSGSSPGTDNMAGLVKGAGVKGRVVRAGEVAVAKSEAPSVKGETPRPVSSHTSNEAVLNQRYTFDEGDPFLEMVRGKDPVFWRRVVHQGATLEELRPFWDEWKKGGNRIVASPVNTKLAGKDVVVAKAVRAPNTRPRVSKQGGVDPKTGEVRTAFKSHPMPRKDTKTVTVAGQKHEIPLGPGEDIRHIKSEGEPRWTEKGRGPSSMKPTGEMEKGKLKKLTEMKDWMTAGSNRPNAVGTAADKPLGSENLQRVMEEAARQKAGLPPAPGGRPPFGPMDIYESQVGMAANAQDRYPTAGPGTTVPAGVSRPPLSPEEELAYLRSGKPVPLAGVSGGPTETAELEAARRLRMPYDYAYEPPRQSIGSGGMPEGEYGYGQAAEAQSKVGLPPLSRAATPSRTIKYPGNMRYEEGLLDIGMSPEALPDQGMGVFEPGPKEGFLDPLNPDPEFGRDEYVWSDEPGEPGYKPSNKPAKFAARARVYGPGQTPQELTSIPQEILDLYQPSSRIENLRMSAMSPRELGPPENMAERGFGGELAPEDIAFRARSGESSFTIPEPQFDEPPIPQDILEGSMGPPRVLQGGKPLELKPVPSHLRAVEGTLDKEAQRAAIEAEVTRRIQEASAKGSTQAAAETAADRAAMFRTGHKRPILGGAAGRMGRIGAGTLGALTMIPPSWLLDPRFMYEDLQAVSEPFEMEYARRMFPEGDPRRPL